MDPVKEGYRIDAVKATVKQRSMVRQHLMHGAGKLSTTN